VSGGFRRFVAGCSRALASPWAMVAVAVYIIGSTAWLIHTGGRESDQLWLNHGRNCVTLWALIALHARDEQKESRS
jgi:hypothetical protein